MSNTEYRKYQTNQKKLARNALAKQQKAGGAVPGGQQQTPNNPRAMSLQTGANPYYQNPMQRQPFPNPNPNPNQNINVNNPRANSLMTTPQQQQQQQPYYQQFQQQQQQQRMQFQQYQAPPNANPSMPMAPPQQRQQEPRTMSLTNPSNRMLPMNDRRFQPPQQQMHPQSQPQVEQRPFYQKIGTSSSSMGSSNPPEMHSIGSSNETSTANTSQTENEFLNQNVRTSPLRNQINSLPVDDVSPIHPSNEQYVSCLLYTSGSGKDFEW